MFFANDKLIKNSSFWRRKRFPSSCRNINVIRLIHRFWINEKKFDIFEANLEIPNKIISTYTKENNEDYIFIFNKDEDSNYFLTTLSLKEPKIPTLSN